MPELALLLELALLSAVERASGVELLSTVARASGLALLWSVERASGLAVLSNVERASRLALPSTARPASALEPLPEAEPSQAVGPAPAPGPESGTPRCSTIAVVTGAALASSFVVIPAPHAPVAPADVTRNKAARDLPVRSVMSGRTESAVRTAERQGARFLEPVRDVHRPIHPSPGHARRSGRLAVARVGP